MKLSGMRDGPKKSVNVPEIPGQLGPMQKVSAIRYCALIALTSAYHALCTCTPAFCSAEFGLFGAEKADWDMRERPCAEV